MHPEAPAASPAHYSCRCETRLRLVPVRQTAAAVTSYRGKLA